MVILIIKGIFLGIITAIPIGPIGMLIAKRTFVKGKLSGIMTGIGASLGDGIYASIAVFSVGAVSLILLRYNFYIGLIGSFILFYIGYKIYKSKIKDDFREYHEHSKEALGDIISAFFLTITNPTLIVSFSAVFAGFGLKDLRGDIYTKIILVIGFIVGSFIWFYILSSIIDRLRKKLTVNTVEIINHFVGVFIMIFAIIYFLSNFAITSVVMNYFK